jgi:PAS domain-containing protein
MHGQTERPYLDRRLETIILAGAPIGVYALDREWRFVYLNGQAERFFQQLSGRTRDHLLGKSIWEECPEVADSTFAREYHQASAEDRTLRLEIFFPVLNRWFAVTAPPAQDIRCFYLEDVTDRVRMHRELRRWRACLPDAEPARRRRTQWPSFSRRKAGCNS